MERIRKHIVFHGRVQGVGFRWRATQAAEMYGCTGWVRNEWDGTVTMEIQGTKLAIDAVISTLERGSYIHVEDTEERQLPIQENESQFTVEF